MKYTTNKNLKLPEYTDIADVADLNENFEAIDEHMGETVISENGAHGFRYDEENQKLEAKTSTGEWEEISLGVDVSGVTATTGKVLAGSKFVTADGVLTDGAMADYSGETVTSNGWFFNSSGVNFNITNSGYYDKDSSYIFESYASMGLSADKIAEGELVLGLTGTHSGGLKVAMGTTGATMYHSPYSGSGASVEYVTITGVGFPAKYVELTFSWSDRTRKAKYFYDLTSGSTEVAEFLRSVTLSNGTFDLNPPYVFPSTNTGSITKNDEESITFGCVYGYQSYMPTISAWKVFG